MVTLIKRWLIAIFILTSTSLFAQDIIVLKNGDEIKAIVQEIGTDAIKYKKFENQAGPTYTMTKSDVFMIKYQNGSKDVFQTENETKSGIASTQQTDAANAKVQKYALVDMNLTMGRGGFYQGDRLMDMNETRRIISSNPEALHLFDSGKRLSNASAVMVGVGTVPILVGLGYCIAAATQSEENKYKADVYYTYGYIFMASGAPPLIVGMCLIGPGQRKFREACEVYNAGNKPLSDKGYQLDIGITSSGGLGLSVKF